MRISSRKFRVDSNLSSVKAYIIKDLVVPPDLEMKNQYVFKRQKILSYNIKSLKIKEHLDVAENLVLIHPCDAIAIEYIDKVFLEEPADPQYKIFREQAIFAIVNCLKSCDGGFCLSTGGSLLNNGFGDLVNNNYGSTDCK